MEMDNNRERALLIGTRNGNKREWDVSASLTRVRVTIPFDAGETISRILRKDNIITKKYSPTGVVIEAEIDKALLDSLKPYVQ